MQGDANIPAGDAEKKRGAETRSSLLAAAQLADPEAWRAIVYLYSPLVLGWCRRCGVHEADAEDVAQEVFQTVVRRMPEFKRERTGSFRAWLRQMAVHKLGDQFRRLRAEKGINIPMEALEQLAIEDSGSGSASSGDMVQTSERTLVCRRALELIRCEFKPRTWEAAWRTAALGQCPSDVANELGMTLSNVYSAKCRVLARLREQLAALEEW